VLLLGDSCYRRCIVPRRELALPALTDRLPLGKSGLSVSPFCLGMVDEGSPETVLAAFDAGINFFFVSTDMHWPLYASLREGLRLLLSRGGGIRDDVVIVATSYVAPAVFLRAPFTELSDAIPNLERIDVCALGGCYRDDPPARRETIVAHRAQGFLGCRAIGASFHDRDLVAEACNEEAFDVAFVRYNAAHPGAREDVFPRLRASSTLLFGFKSVGGWASPEELARVADLPAGLWLPKPSDHYRFALSQVGLDGLLCSPGTPAEVEALAKAMAKGPLDEEQQQHLVNLALLACGDAQVQ
jgi:hypothetical protein